MSTSLQLYRAPSRTASIVRAPHNYKYVYKYNYKYNYVFPYPFPFPFPFPFPLPLFLLKYDLAIQIARISGSAHLDQ